MCVVSGLPVKQAMSSLDWEGELVKPDSSDDDSDEEKNASKAPSRPPAPGPRPAGPSSGQSAHLLAAPVDLTDAPSSCNTLRSDRTVYRNCAEAQVAVGPI